mgnify:CR=1 FL=1
MSPLALYAKYFESLGIENFLGILPIPGYFCGRKKTRNSAGIIPSNFGISARNTTLVPTPLWRGGKKNASTGGRVAKRLIEEKRSGLKQNTLLIEGFKLGPSFCLFVKKLELTCSQPSWPIFHHGN